MLTYLENHTALNKASNEWQCSFLAFLHRSGKIISLVHVATDGKSTTAGYIELSKRHTRLSHVLARRESNIRLWAP